jgi:hypothetical protein
MNRMVSGGMGGTSEGRVFALVVVNETVNFPLEGPGRSVKTDGEATVEAGRSCPDVRRPSSIRGRGARTGHDRGE